LYTSYFRLSNMYRLSSLYTSYFRLSNMYRLNTSCTSYFRPPNMYRLNTSCTSYFRPPNMYRLNTSCTSYFRNLTSLYRPGNSGTQSYDLNHTARVHIVHNHTQLCCMYRDQISLHTQENNHPHIHHLSPLWEFVSIVLSDRRLCM
jgi:hypothetical protein